MSELPQNWIKTNFGSICDGGQYGWTTRASDKGSIKFLRTTDITKGKINWESVPYCQDNPPDLDRYLIQENDILISRAGSVGFSALIDKAPLSAIFASYLIRFMPSEHVDPRYVAYFLKSPEYWQQITEAASGIAISNVNAKKLAGISMPLAPINEQKRIADKLDNLLAQVGECRNRLAKVALILRVIRQSIFDVATSGELTRDWVYTDDPRVWQEVKVEDILVEKPRNGYSPKAVDYETKTRSLTLTATTSGKFNPKYVKYIDEDIPEHSHLWLEPGDILIQRANSLEYVGVSAIYDGPSRGYIYPDLMMKCKANDRVLTEYLYYLFSSSSVRSYFRKNATGTTGNMPKINQKTILSTPVSIPSLDEQGEVVRRAKVLLAHVEGLEVYYGRACLKIDKITASLLHKAFSGELVPQHLNDETASDLLERILLLKAETKSKIDKAPKREQKSSGIKSNLNMLKRDNIQPNHLSEILRISGPIPPENLWSLSQLEIDDFYEQLKEEEEGDLLKESRKESDDSSRLLEVV